MYACCFDQLYNSNHIIIFQCEENTLPFTVLQSQEFFKISFNVYMIGYEKSLNKRTYNVKRQNGIKREKGIK